MSYVSVFERLLLSEMRTVVISHVGVQFLTDQNLVKAMTVNEELKNLGYTLKPQDIINLAKFENLDMFMTAFRNLLGDVKAKPMYPNFPTQVMSLSEGEFRFHQLMHYFSTYGAEWFTGTEVSKGWLPDVESTEKTEKDVKLLNSKVLQLFINTNENPIYDYVYKKILSKNERMTDKEVMLLNECLENITDYSVKVSFKQNLLTVFYKVFSTKLPNSAKLLILKGLCQHTGDVWKCMDYTLTQENFHLRTSQKKLIVKLLESYPIEDFKSNLILSNKKGERTNLMLRYLDYNTYSRSLDHKLAVMSFRSGELKSWESRAKYLITTKNPNALEFICTHPGTAVRMLTYLLRNGYDAQSIYITLRPYASKLSTQTLVSLCTYFGKIVNEESKPNYFTQLCKENGLEIKPSESSYVYNIAHSLLRDKMLSMKTPLCSKKLYVDMAEYNLSKSVLLTNNKSAEGGYIRSGIAYRIPEYVDRLRFFVYWNDEHRVDVDLHASALTKERSIVHIGWCGGYNDDSTGIVFSGDITHSDAAEFIDIDLNKTTAANVTFNIDLYSGKPCFKEIDECYVGCMAVDSIGTNVALYDPKNCFFTHYLTGDTKSIHYGFVDVENRCIVFVGTENRSTYDNQVKNFNTKFTLDTYITDLAETQACIAVDNPEDADVVLVMGKPSNDKEISLIDNNFFMDSES